MFSIQAVYRLDATAKLPTVRLVAWYTDITTTFFTCRMS